MVIRLKVREIAEAKGWNASRLGRRADLSNAAIYGIWNETTANPGIETLARIAQVLGVRTHDLYEVVGETTEGNRNAELLAA